MCWRALRESAGVVKFVSRLVAWSAQSGRGFWVVVDFAGTPVVANPRRRAFLDFPDERVETRSRSGLVCPADGHIIWRNSAPFRHANDADDQPGGYVSNPGWIR